MGKGSKGLCALTSIGVWLQRCVSMLTVVDISMPSYVEIFIHWYCALLSSSFGKRKPLLFAGLVAQTIAAQTDLWLSNKEIESACWWYSNTHPQLLTSSPNSKPCFLTCVLPISSFHLKKYSNPLKRPVLRNHSSCHSFFFFFYDLFICCKSL